MVQSFFTFRKNGRVTHLLQNGRISRILKMRVGKVKRRGEKGESGRRKRRRVMNQKKQMLRWGLRKKWNMKMPPVSIR